MMRERERKKRNEHSTKKNCRFILFILCGVFFSSLLYCKNSLWHFVGDSKFLQGDRELLLYVPFFSVCVCVCVGRFATFYNCRGSVRLFANFILEF